MDFCEFHIAEQCYSSIPLFHAKHAKTLGGYRGLLTECLSKSYGFTEPLVLLPKLMPFSTGLDHSPHAPHSRSLPVAYCAKPVFLAKWIEFRTEEFLSVFSFLPTRLSLRAP